MGEGGPQRDVVERYAVDEESCPRGGAVSIFAFGESHELAFVDSKTNIPALSSFLLRKSHELAFVVRNPEA